MDTENRKRLDYKKLRLADDYRYLSEEEQEKEKEQEQEKEPVITDVNTFNERINKKQKDINEKLFKRHFNFQRSSDMFNFLNNINDIEKNNELVDVITSGLKDLREEIKKMSEEERKVEKPDKTVKIAREILKFNKQNQKGKGIKILTPNQMLSRLPISVAQLKAGNTSEKMKNEIR